VYAIDSLVNGALAYFAFVYKVSVVYILSSEYYASAWLLQNLAWAL